MKYKEFLEYMENNLDGYKSFTAKAMQFQRKKNAKRQPAAKRWSEEKMQKASYEMWKKAMEPLYNKLKAEIKSDLRPSWISFIEKHDIFESVNEGISDIDFSEEGV